jgi:hypothetical protein
LHEEAVGLAATASTSAMSKAIPSGAPSRNATGFTTQNSTKNMNTAVNNSRLIDNDQHHMNSTSHGIAR